MFHKRAIYYQANKAWKKYKNDPEYFSFPERITIEITNRCNLDCFMCPRHKVKMELGDMDFNLFKKIIDEASLHLPICLVPFFRGESFLHPYFFEMISYAKEKELKPIQLASNANHLNTELISRLLDLKVDFISISVDLNKSDIFKSNRKNSDFKTLFPNIFFLLEEKKKKNLDLPKIQVSAIKTRRNASTIQEFIDFWRNKADRVRIYYAHSLDGKLGHLQEKNKLKRKPCLKLLTDIVIYWNGDVALCNHDWDRDVFIGNVFSEFLENIWSNTTYNKIRKMHLDDTIDAFVPCNYCSHWKMYYQENHVIGELYEK